MSLGIRAFQEEDRPALERMSAEIVDDGTVFPFEDIEGVLGYWFSKGARVHVACEDDVVVGSYVIKPNHPDRGAHVANAGYMVAEEQRGKGVGEALGRHSLDTARELGYVAMQFNYVVKTNASAVRLWQRLGFRILGEVPGGFRHPELGYVNIYVMFREL